jgi:hypothetical protein
VRMASQSGQAGRELAPALSQLATSYAAPLAPGAAAPGPRPGARLPAIAGRAVPGWLAIAADRYTTLLWGAPAAGEARPRLEAATEVIEASPADYPGLTRVLGPAPALVLVRPDGHLAAIATPGQAGELAATAAALTRTTQHLTMETAS